MSKYEIDYLIKTLKRHICIHFHPEAVSIYQDTEIISMPYYQIASKNNLKPGTIILPTLDQIDSVLIRSWEVKFRSTSLTLWGFLEAPSNDWQIDDKCNPLWYKSSDGVFMPAWDMVGILLGLLTLKEEKSSNQIDIHGRFTGSMSPRALKGLLNIPIFNNAAALLVDKCLFIKSPQSYNDIPFSKPINICLSHDLDQLRGDDFWTQASKIGRMLSPLKQFKTPNFSQLRLILKNIINPRKYYMDDLLSMVNAEQEYGYRSVHYVLCGKKGRYGARTKSKYINKYLPEISSDCEIGIHYNYDTHLDKDKFLYQKRELESISEKKIISGRAHYLRMDSKLSFEFWSIMGINNDESLGYPDKIGYRAGIAGPFFPLNNNLDEELNIVILPLIAMDSCMINTYGKSAIAEIEKHIAHLSIVGGTFTLLFHPGRYHSDEFPISNGLYDDLLALFFKYKSRCILPGELGKLLDS